MDAGNQAALALLDMTAAFDAVDHEILLERMRRSYGVSGPALAWFTSYLSGRSASVRQSVCKIYSFQLLISAQRTSRV